MKKTLRKTVSLVCAVAMIVASMVFAPTKVDAGQTLPTDMWTNVGAWQLYNGNALWCSYATMEYTSTGSALGDTTVTLTNSPNGDWNDVEYGLAAKLSNYSADKGMETGNKYDCNLRIRATKGGTLIAIIEGVQYEKTIEESDSFQDVVIATFSHSISASSADVVLYYGMFPKGTDITISDVDFVKNFDDVEETEKTTTEETTTADPWIVIPGSPSNTYYWKDPGYPYGLQVINIQSPKWAEETGVYITVQEPIINITVNGSSDGADIQGAGTIVYLSKLTKRINEVTIDCGYIYQYNVQIKNIYGPEESTTAFPTTKAPPETPSVEPTTRVPEPTTDVPAETTGLEDEWNIVPNADPTYTDGPWNMYAYFDSEHEGNNGVLHYKKNGDNPTYSDYTFRATSVSGWEAWTVFARLENYLADYYDFGDAYDITLTINSSQATVPKTDPEVLDQLLVVVGVDKYYFDLDEGINILHIKGDNYNVYPSDPHEQILLEMDGLQPGTELTVQSIQVTGPNDGWTNVPNKQNTKVCDWTLFGWWNETHWSKLAYKNHTGGTGLGAIDIKARRVSGDFGAMAALAMLPDYLATAKDTKNRPIANADDYQIKVTMNASGLDSSVTDYGKVRLLANDQAFDFDIQKGTKTYDLLELCGKKMTYDSLKTGDVEFELDKVSQKAVLNIQKIEFVGTEDDTQEYTTDITTEAPTEVTTETPITEESTAEPTTAPEPTTNPDIDSLREQVNQLSESLSQHIENYNTQISTLEAQLAQLQSELEDGDEALSGGIDELNTQLTDIRNQIVDINLAMEELENDVANNSTSIGELQSDMESVLDDLSTVDNRIEDAKTEVENTVKAYVDNQVEELSGEINTINNSINGLIELIGVVPEGTNLQSEIVDIQNSVQAIEDELDSVDLDQIDNNKQQISTLQSQLLSITNTIAQNLLTETQNRINDTSRLTNTIDTINNSLKAKDVELQTQIDTLSSQLQTANADIQSINEQVVEIQGDIAANATNISKNASDIQSLVEQLSAAVAELNTVDNRIQTAKDDTLTLAQTYTDQKIAELNAEFENRMKEQGDDFENKYNEQKEEIDRLNKEILGLKMSSGSTSVRLSYASKSLVNLSWNKHPYASGYEVYVMKPGKSAYELVADVKSQAFSYSIAMNLSYKFMVKVYMNDEKSASKVYGLDSNAVSANAITPGRVVLKKVKAGKKKCTVQWNAVPKAVGYQIYYKQKKAKTITVKANQLSQVIKKLKKKKKVTVKVRAFVTYGVNTLYGAWSNTKKVKIK